MQMRELGHSGVKVPPFCFGCNVFGWTVDEPTAFQLLDNLVSHGFNFLDTADIYTNWADGNKGGESETIIGNWLKQRGKREQIIIATKVGKPMSANKKGLAKAYILQAVEDSLKRLQTDYIDLYQSHEDDPGTPLEETLGAYTQLVQQGKVRVIGASNFNPERLEQSLQVSKEYAYPSYQCMQVLYNLCDRADYETLLEPVCIKNGLGVITYFSLASGFLTGKYRSESDLSQSERGNMVKKYLNERGFAILQALEVMAKRYQANSAQVSLAWLMSRQSVTAAIASATNLKQLTELMKAAQLKLDKDAIEILNAASA